MPSSLIGCPSVVPLLHSTTSPNQSNSFNAIEKNPRYISDLALVTTLKLTKIARALCAALKKTDCCTLF